MLNVQRKPSVCRHAGVCARTRPTACKIEDGSVVIDRAAADAAEVREVDGACLSDALTISAA